MRAPAPFPRKTRMRQSGRRSLRAGTGRRAARELGRSWKVNPFLVIPAGETVTLADIGEAGAIQHIWMTPAGHWRYLILRIYWDGQESPSVKYPAGDFFCCGWNEYAQLSALPVCLNPVLLNGALSPRLPHRPAKPRRRGDRRLLSD